MPNQSLKNATLLAYALLLIGQLSWAGNAIVGRILLHSMPPLSLSFHRWLLAFCILLPFTWRGVWMHRQTLLASWSALLLLATLGIAGYNSFQYLALTATSVINVVLIASSIPVILLPLSMIFLKERPRWLAVVGVLLSLAGVVLVLSHGQSQTLRQWQFARGDLIMLLSVLCWAGYTILLRTKAPKVPTLVSLTVQMALGTLVILPFYLIEASLSNAALNQLEGFTPTLRNLAALGYIAMFPSIVAFACWDRGVRVIGPSRAGMFVNFIPIFASILAVVFLDERFHLYHAIALTLLCTGVALHNQARSQ